MASVRAMMRVGTFKTSAASRPAASSSAHHVCGQPRRDEFLNRFLCRDENFAAHVTAFFLARELIFEMHSGGTGFDHRLDQLEDVQRTAEARLRIGDDRRKPIDLVSPFGVIDLVGTLQRLVDSPNDSGNAVCRIETLVRIHLAGEIGVGRDLPAAEIDRFEAGFYLLNSLVASQRAERRDEGLSPQQLPKFLRAPAREGVLRHNAALQPLHLG